MDKYRCFVAGKSGGHIIPALVQAETYLMESPDHKAIFFSTTTDLDQRIINQTIGDRLEVIPLTCCKKPTSIIGYGMFVYQFFSSVCKALWHLYQKKPACTTSTGGLVALPVCLASRLLNIPIYLIELNAVPGKAIKTLAHLATTIFVCFPQAQQYFSAQKCSVIPYPLRSSLQQKIPAQSAVTNKKILLVLGGSQGSQFINNLMMTWVMQMPRDIKNNIAIMHQVGSADEQIWQQFYEQHQLQAQVFSFTLELAQLYRQAQLIICRAGAGTLFEIAYFQKPCITIPLVTRSTNHQLYNARALAQQCPFIKTMLQTAIEKNKDQFFMYLQNQLGQPSGFTPNVNT